MILKCPCPYCGKDVRSYILEECITVECDDTECDYYMEFRGCIEDKKYFEIIENIHSMMYKKIKNIP